MANNNKPNRFFENITPEIMCEIDNIIDAACSVYKIKSADIRRTKNRKMDAMFQLSTFTK